MTTYDAVASVLSEIYYAILFFAWSLKCGNI